MSNTAHALEAVEPFHRKAIRDHLGILAVLLAALTVRLLCVTFLAGAIGTEGAEYARIGENILAGKGYTGIATEGTELMFPPLFPFLIAAFSLLTHEAELAARLVSAIMGALLVLPIFFITSRSYRPRTAYIAAALVAFHPLLVLLSATAFCEASYITLILAGAYWSQRAQSDQTRRAFVFAGLFFGLAYLIRPEASVYAFLTVAAFLVFTAITHRHRLGQVALSSCLLMVVFLAFAGPYIAWLSRETGQFRIEGKSAIIYAMDHGVVSEADASKVQYGIDQNLRNEGVWNVSNRTVIESTHPNLTGLTRLYAEGAKNNLPILVKGIVVGPSLGSPILLGLAILVLLRTRWRRELVIDHFFLFLVLAVTTLSLAAHPGGMSNRYFFIFLPILIVWAAQGVDKVSRWAGAILPPFGYAAATRLKAEMVVQLAAGSAIFLIALFGIAHFTALTAYDYRSRPVKAAGE